MQEILNDLLRPEFAAAVGVVSSPSGARRALLNSNVVRELRSSIRGGLVTESDIRRFSDELSSQFVKGERFPFELALASLAVALETRQTDFVDEFLLDLARLQRLAEFSFAPQVAAISRQRWSQLPKTKSKSESAGPTASGLIVSGPRVYGSRAAGTATEFSFRQYFDNLETA